MRNFLSPNQAVTIRPASPEDFPAIARLLLQLYRVELPGALHGPQAAQQELLHFTLAAKGDQGLRGAMSPVTPRAKSWRRRRWNIRA